jgi:hypothetical protein
MIRTTIISALILISASINAQDSTRVKKNEIGVTVTPIVLKLLGGESYDVTFGITYKRLFEGGAFKASLRSVTASVYPVINEFSPGTALYGADTTITVRSIAQSPQKTFQLRTGLQKHLPINDRFFWFTGGDLVLSSSHVRKAEFETIYRSDSTLSAAGYNYNVTEGRSAHTQSKSLSVGVSPYVGIHTNISRRFSVEIQSGFQFLIGRETGGFITRDYHVKNYNSSLMTFDALGNLSEINLFYKF